MPVFVKASRRGKSIVKAYTRISTGKGIDFPSKMSMSGANKLRKVAAQA